MVDYAATGQEALSRIAAADDLETLEGLRVAFLGKQGSISGLLKTLGGMSPEERQSEGPKIHGLREQVTEALAARKDALEGAALVQAIGQATRMSPVVVAVHGGRVVALVRAVDVIAALRS